MTLQTPPRAADGGAAPILKGAVRWCGFRLARLSRAWAERDARCRAARQLEKLEDHLLRDIGLTRDDVRSCRP